MLYLTGHNYEALADTGVLATIKKPILTGKVFILRINVWCTKNIDFGRWIGYMNDPDHDFPREILFRKIVPQVGTYGAVLFEGRQEWPHEWEISLIGKTQITLNHVWWSVEYEIVEKVKKPGWGD